VPASESPHTTRVPAERASAHLTAAAAAEQARESDGARPPPEERVLGMPASSAVDELVGVSGAIGPLALVIISRPAPEKSMLGN